MSYNNILIKLKLKIHLVLKNLELNNTEKKDIVLEHLELNNNNGTK